MGSENIHPAHKEILDQIPAEYHHLVIPTLQKWDKGVQERFQELHTQYEPLKAFESFVKNNIDADYAEQAVLLADQLQRDPAKVVQQVNEAWNLGFVPKDQVTPQGSQQDPADFSFDEDDDDILKNPKVKAMYDSLTKLQTEFQTEKEREQEAAEQAEFEEYLNTLESETTSKNLPFNRMFVTALISQGVDGEDAVKQYHQVLAGNVQVETNPETTQENPNPAPPVMGGEGTAGSGSPDGSVDFGALSKNQLNSTIEQMLVQQMNSGQ